MYSIFYLRQDIYITWEILPTEAVISTLFLMFQV